MTYPSHDYDGLEHPNTDPFADFEPSEDGGSILDTDVDETVEDLTFNDVDLM